MADTTIKVVTIVAKSKNNKSFKAGDDWYNVLDNVIPYLEKAKKGDEITITFYKKGTANYVTLLKIGKVEYKKEKSATGFKCEDCGTDLKDGKYKKCYTCNKKNPVKKEETIATGTKSTKTYTTYDNPEKTAQIQRGNALNAAGAVAGGQSFADPETAKQFTLELANAFLEWLRLE